MPRQGRQACRLSCRGQGFAIRSQARPSTPTESSSRRTARRQPCVTDWSFSFRCPRPRITPTQLRFDTARLLAAQERTSTALFSRPLRRTSAGFQPAVSRISNLRASPTADTLPNGTRRCSRLETCATSFRHKITPRTCDFFRATPPAPPTVRRLRGAGCQCRATAVVERLGSAPVPRPCGRDGRC